MANGGNGAGLLRVRGEGEPQVTSMELFFDLVYVLAITQLSHHLLVHLNFGGALQTLLLLVAVWRAWIEVAWFTNWFDPDRRAVRLLLVGLMLASLLMSASLPEAFGERGLLFAGVFVTMAIGRGLFAVMGSREEPGLRLNFERILCWAVMSGLLWLAGGFAEGPVREGLWVAAVAVDFLGPAVGYFTPGLGRSRTTDWPITGGHMAERCRLFIILALGESILVTGATFGDLPLSVAAMAGFVAAFLSSVALWWIYFDRSADYASAVISHSPDPGRLGRSAYTYFHLPMVAGIIVTAVGDDLIIAHPMEATSASTAAVILGGPALFLAGHALFKRAVFNHVTMARPAAVLALIVLAPVSLVVSPLVLSLGATAIMAGVVISDSWMLRHSGEAILAPPVASGQAKEEGVVSSPQS
ncbi:MAG: low temperature requirement protein A [Chloroflexia bacterium]